MSAGKKYKYNTNAFVNEFNIQKEEHWIGWRRKVLDIV